MPTYQQEFLATCQQDAQELLKLHWEEIALNKDKIKLNPDWEVYAALEQSGNFNIFTVREGGELLGYCAVFIQVNPHYKDHLFAMNDVIFLHPDHRKGFTGVKLIRFAEKCLKEDGVSVFTMNTKLHKPFGKILERLGFSAKEVLYQKYLGD